MSRHKPRGGPKPPKETPLSKRVVFFAVLNERAIQHEAIDAREDLGEVARIMGAERIRSAYSRVDVARNRISKKFMELTKNPKDTVVMLDTARFESGVSFGGFGPPRGLCLLIVPQPPRRRPVVSPGYS